VDLKVSAGGLSIKDAEEVAVECAGNDGAGPVLLDELTKVDDAVRYEGLLAAVVVDDFAALGRVTEYAFVERLSLVEGGDF